jgi:hypothetical protein
MTICNWHPQQKRRRYVFAAGALALTVVVWLATRSDREFWPRLIASLFALVAFGVLIEQDTRLDADARTVVREGRLFGRCRVWLWRNSLSDFTGVAIRRQPDSDGGCDTVFVGLQQRNGRLMALSYFFVGIGQPSVEAERAAQNLVDMTGLQLHEPVA